VSGAILDKEDEMILNIMGWAACFLFVVLIGCLIVAIINLLIMVIFD